MSHLLTDPWFEAHFFTKARIDDNGQESWRSHRGDDTPWDLSEAQGILFYCPCTFGTDSGAHMVMVVFANPPCGVPAPVHFGPMARDGKTRPRWTVRGMGIADLSLQPSIDVGAQSCWHGYITNGVVL